MTKTPDIPTKPRAENSQTVAYDIKNPFRDDQEGVRTYRR
jgi:hypothetical protein